MKQLIQDSTGLPIGIKDDLYWIKETVSSKIDKLVIEHHYSHKATKNRFLSFMVGTNATVTKPPHRNEGFLQLGYGIRPRMKHTITKLITSENYCEFDRMWLSDSLPKFSESRVIGLLLSYLRQVYKRIQFVITYADGSVGNYGTIYKATNAIPIGKTKVDFYLLPDGERIHPVSMWHRHKTRKWVVVTEIYPGIKHITNEFQYKFLYILNKKIKKAYMQEGR